MGALRLRALPTRGRTLEQLVVLAVLAVGFVLGYVLVGLGSRFGTAGPAVVALVPLLPAVALLVLAEPRWGIAAIVASFPVGTMSVPVVPAQLVQIVTLGAAVLVAIRRLAAGSSPLPLTPLMWWVAGFCTWLVIALPSAADSHLASREVVLFAVGLMCAGLVVAVCSRVSDVAFVLGALLAVIAASALIVPFNVDDLRAHYGGAVVAGRATGIFGEPNQMGTFAATGALVGIALALAGQTRPARWLPAVAAVVCTVALLLSLSRGAWIGFAFGMAVLVIRLREMRRLLVLGAVPLFIFAVVIGSFAPSSPQAEIVGARLRSITGERNPYDDRPALWREAVREVMADPVTGQGPGNFRVASARATSKSRTVSAEHAHNQMLTWGAENGMPAVVIAAGLMGSLYLSLRRVARRVTRRDRAMVAGVAAALTAIAGQGIVDYTLHNSVILTTLFIVLGCAFALDRIVLRRA